MLTLGIYFPTNTATSPAPLELEDTFSYMKELCPELTISDNSSCGKNTQVATKALALDVIKAEQKHFLI
ncbi:hypothetical protein J6590_103188, partial [Homalodisca vitripennis]